jgi:hypothetical protein
MIDLFLSQHNNTAEPFKSQLLLFGANVLIVIQHNRSTSIRASAASVFLSSTIRGPFRLVLTKGIHKVQQAREIPSKFRKTGKK